MEARTEEVLNADPLVSAAARPPRQALARAAEAGIHLLRIPTPFAVGRVNTYLIEDDPLTLVDSGPNSGRALDELQHQLAEHGHSIDDIELVVLTHQHIDHLGLVDIIVGHSGRRGGGDRQAGAASPSTSREDAARDDEFASGVMLRNGIPEDIVHALRTVSSAFRAWGSEGKGDAAAARRRDAGAARPRRSRCCTGPGTRPPTPSSGTSDRRILIAADHLIKHISSNPLIAGRWTPEGDPDPARRPQALVTYMESLRKTRELPAEIVLSGHGEPITDHVALIDERFEFHAPAGGEDPRADRRAPAHRLRPGPGAVRRHRRHAGLPDAVRGAGPRRPAAERRPRARGRAGRRGVVRGDA